MHTEATKIILLVSAPQQHVRIGGVELPVVGLTRGGDVPPIVSGGCAGYYCGMPGRANCPSSVAHRNLQPVGDSTDCLPPNREFEGEEEYDAGNAATALDQIVTDRQTADEYPIPTLGQWTNYAELATGLGWATVNQPSFNKAAGRFGRLTSPPQEAGLSWVVNIFEFPGVGYTGKRTPAGLWLSDHCTGISTFKVSGLEEFTQMTGMGEWWGNDYFIQPMTRQDDAAQVERGLMRIDPLEVGERDFLRSPWKGAGPGCCQRPPPWRARLGPSGITVRNRDWSVPNLRIIALSPRVAQWLETTQTIPPIVYKTPVHAPVYKGSGAQAIYKKYGLGKALGRRKGGNSAGENFSAGPGGQPSPEARAGDEAAPGEVTAVSAGVAARPSGNVGQAAGGLERSVDMQKPAPGGSGTDPAPKVATTPEAAERNADHRKAEDVA
ncbi:hypothetical protein ACJJTC_006473 [Scirpophaga incertulas]